MLHHRLDQVYLLVKARNDNYQPSDELMRDVFFFFFFLYIQVVSGLGREIPSPNGQAIRGAIQTDASINAGNI